MARRRPPFDSLVDHVTDEVAAAFDNLMEGLLVAGIGVLAGAVAGKAAPVVVERVKAVLRPPAPAPARKPNPKTKARLRQALPSPRKRPPVPSEGLGEVIDLHPDGDGVYR